MSAVTDEPRACPGKPATNRRTNVYIDGYNFYVPLSADGSRETYALAWCDFRKLGALLVRRAADSRPDVFADAELGAVKYFTATIPEGLPSNRSGLQRKRDWLDALHHHTNGHVEVVHGTFRAREHRFYIERDELPEFARGGIPIAWDLLDPKRETFHPKLRIHEEKQTDVMLAYSVVLDIALGSRGYAPEVCPQKSPDHLTNPRPRLAPCQAAIIVSADTDFLPAAEAAASFFHAPVGIAFTFPHCAYELPGRPGRLHADLTALEVSADELRRCMLPTEVPIPGGRVLTLDHFVRSHFDRVRATGG